MGSNGRNLSGIDRFLTYLIACALSLATGVSQAADYDSAIEQVQSGKYEEALAEATALVTDRPYSERHWRLKLRIQLTLGRYADALLTYEEGLKRFPTSLQLRWLGEQALRHSGQSEKAQAVLAEIPALAQRSSWRYGDVESRVILGRYFQGQGADARQVLSVFFDPLKKSYTRSALPYLASAQLALEKHDYKIAADELKKAVELAPDDPDVHFAISRAYASSDSKKSKQALQTALEKNGNHIPSLLSLVDDNIDSESYDNANALLAQVLKVNPVQPEAWAYRAVLAHLDNKMDEKGKHREKALSTWKENPEVDHLIGRKLSEKYRFKEGSLHQRMALQFNDSHQPSRIQLCQDLLRLGQEQEGWDLAASIAKRDEYNILAHNLLTLKDELDQFVTLSSPNFELRMDQAEADVYGHRALALLERARLTLCEKYDIELTDPVIVEIFPKQPDFAIRTFGMPGGEGFLGVCFGRVITANSPASRRDNPVNWESVLWHEYCHVVTLQKTRNRMPRWLSEGISVYEERQENASWGQHMNPGYRDMILGEDLTPVSRLSSAFLSPKSALHLQFAYYESSLVVEFLVDQFGSDVLVRILEDLGKGLPINDAISRHTIPIEEMDVAFDKYARSQAESLGNEVDWASPEFEGSPTPEAISSFVDKHPRNVRGWLLKAAAAQAAGDAKSAESALKESIKLLPEQRGATSAYRQLAGLYTANGQDADARAQWIRVLELESDAIDAARALIDMAIAGENQADILEYTDYLLAIDPLRSQTHELRVAAARKLDRPEMAVDSLQAMVAMAPTDPARLYFELAESLLKADQKERARESVLKSLEIAPRYQAALELLVEIKEEAGGNPSPAVRPRNSEEAKP